MAPPAEPSSPSSGGGAGATLMQGFLHKKASGKRDMMRFRFGASHAWAKRYFILVPSHDGSPPLLAYFAAEPSAATREAISLGVGVEAALKGEKSGVVLLDSADCATAEVDAEELEKGGKAPTKFGFSVGHPEHGLRYLAAETDASRAAWCAAIGVAVAHGGDHAALSDTQATRRRSLSQTYESLQDAADGHHAGEASSSKGGDAAPVPSDDEIDALGIKALRELIERAGLSHAGCVEKPELKARAKEAAVALRANAPPPAPGAARAMPPSPPSSPTSVALVGSPVDAVLKIAASQPGGAAAGEALSAKVVQLRAIAALQAESDALRTEQLWTGEES